MCGAEKVERRVFDFQNRGHASSMRVVVTGIGFASGYHLDQVSYKSQLLGCAIDQPHKARGASQSSVPLASL